MRQAEMMWLYKKTNLRLCELDEWAENILHKDRFGSIYRDSETTQHGGQRTLETEWLNQGSYFSRSLQTTSRKVLML